MERTVGTDAHPQRVVLRFDVHVGRAVADGLLEDQVDDLDDRRVLVDFDDDGVGRLGELLASHLGALFEVAQRVVDLDVRAVAVIERPLELVLARRRRGGPVPRALRSAACSSCSMSRVGARDDARARLVRASGIAPQLARDRLGKAVRDLDVELVAREIDGAESELRGERHRDVARREHCGAHEDLAETARRCLTCSSERGVALRLGDELLRDEDVAQRQPDRLRGIRRT